jgi:predicted GIY-YIG superfamily endonuclease
LGEQHDLSKKMPEKTAQLEKELKVWESTKKEALWREQKRWQVWRHNYHISWFKTGKPPGKKK